MSTKKNNIFAATVTSFTSFKNKDNSVSAKSTNKKSFNTKTGAINNQNHPNVLALSSNLLHTNELNLQSSILSSPSNISSHNVNAVTPSFKDNTILDLSKSQQISIMNIPNGNVNVMCRFRPVSDKEKEQNKNLCTEYIDNYQVSVKSSHDFNSTYRFSFDRIFGPNSSQKEVFDISAKPIIDSVLEGFNGTIFAYGQTSSGKTYTMLGDLDSNENQGVIPRMVQHVFSHIANSPSEFEYTVKLSMMEIYMEKIRDLIETERVNLKIREDKNRGNFVEELSEHYVSSEEEVMDLIYTGSNNRTTKFTYMNDFSSRSHTILMLVIKSTNVEDLTTKIGKLFLVDLAGSEKISKTGATGLTLEEAKNINKSLTTLGMVITSLTDEKSTYIPYRESKVTRILQESLGGNSKTCLIITCSPSSANDSETLSTLRFGMRAKKIENKPKINKEISAIELKQEIEKLESLLYESNIKNSQLVKLLQGNGIQIPAEIYNTLKSPKKISKATHRASISTEDDPVINLTPVNNSQIPQQIPQFHSQDLTNSCNIVNKEFRKSSESQSQKAKSNNNTRYLETGKLSHSPDNNEKNDSSIHSTNKISNLLSENRSLIKKLKEADELIKKLKIETEEKQRVITDLFELKYKFEDIETDNINKIQFLERKIKKLKYEMETEKGKEMDITEDQQPKDESDDPIRLKVKELVAIVSESNPVFEYNLKEFTSEVEKLIVMFKTKSIIKTLNFGEKEDYFSQKSFNADEESRLKDLQSDFNKKIDGLLKEKELISKSLKHKEDQMHAYESQIIEMKSKIDFYESQMTLENKHYAKKIDALENSLNQVNKLYHQVLTQKSVLKIENDVLSMLVSKKNDTISKLDKEMDVIKDNKEQVENFINIQQNKHEKPVNYVKGHKKSLNHNVVKVLKGGKTMNISKTGNISSLDANQDKSSLEIIIDEKK